MLRPDVPTPPDRWEAAMALLEAALERPAAERLAYVASAAGGDAALREEVSSLLAMEPGGAGFLESPAVPEGADATFAARVRVAAGAALGAASGAALGTPPDDPAAAARAVAGRRVGPYRIVREVGRGGMGTVYLATRDDLGRQVALKLVRGGLAAPEHVERFLLERRVLARLDHPNVARLLDAGVTEDGTPWFAMEYVEGEALDRYCDARRLTVAERLALVEQVCDAVAYAHRNLVVHRDLKPSNILVTAAGEVKLLDFGIAKLLAADPAEVGDALTGTGVLLLTPEYAAPEQARGEAVTTATDVYALGVTLYELLTGVRPQRTTSGPPGGLVPQRPVSRPSSVVARGEAAVAVAAARRATPDRLRRQLAGDLDTVVGKALESDPERRYPSAAALLDDLRRQRTGFPVRARPASGAHRAWMFARRHRAAVAAVVGVFAWLAGTAAFTAVQAARTRRALAEATIEGTRARQALARASAEAAKARQVTRFVASLFSGADPYRVGARAPASPSGAADGLLALGAERLERELAQQPAVRAELLHTLGVVQRNLGHWDQADTLLRRALAARRQTRGPPGVPDPELAGLLHDLGVVRRLKSDFGGADTLLTQALAMREGRPGDHGADGAATRYELALVRRYQARYDEAERLLAPAIATLRRAPGPALADALDQLAALHVEMLDPRAGVESAREAIAVRERWEGRDHPAVAGSYHRLSHALRYAGRVGEAEPAIRRAIDIQRRRLPAEHPDLVAAESELSWVLLEQGRLAEAERVQRRVLEVRRRLNGDFSRDAAGSFHTLGIIRSRRGALAEASALLRRALAANGRAFGPDDMSLAASLEALAVVEARRGREAEALGAAAHLQRVRRMIVWDSTAQPLATLGSLLRADGDCPGAARRYRRSAAVYASRHRGLPPDDPRIVRLRAEEGACRRSAVLDGREGSRGETAIVR